MLPYSFPGDRKRAKVGGGLERSAQQAARLRCIWEELLLAVTLWQFCSLVFRLCLGADDTFVHFALDASADVVLLFDWVLRRFLVTFTELDSSPLCVAGVFGSRPSPHVRSGLWFWADMVSFLPLDLFAYALGFRGDLTLFRINRVLRVPHIPDHLRIIVSYQVFVLGRFCNPGYRRMVELFVLMALTAHTCGCMFYGLAYLETRKFGVSDTWASVDGLWLVNKTDGGSVSIVLAKPLAVRYLRCVYWAVITQVTTGFGDIVPFGDSIVESLFVTGAMFVGVLVTTTAVANLTLLIATLDSRSSMLERRLELVGSFLRLRHCNPDLLQRSRAYFRFMYERRLDDENTKALCEWCLPAALRSVIFTHRAGIQISAVPLFREHAPARLLRYLTIALEEAGTTIFLPGDALVRQGTKLEAMLLISRGCAWCVTSGAGTPSVRTGKRPSYGAAMAECAGLADITCATRQQENEMLLRRLSRGDYFGEMALFATQRCPVTLRAESFLEVFALTRSTFEGCVERYTAAAGKDARAIVSELHVYAREHRSRNPLFEEKAGAAETLVRSARSKCCLPSRATPRTGTAMLRSVAWRLPDSRFRQRWNILLCLGLLYNTLSLSVEFAFFFQHSVYRGKTDLLCVSLMVVNALVDLLFVADLFLCAFLFAFVAKDGTIATGAYEIWLHYACGSRVKFVCDVVAAMPTDLIAISTGVEWIPILRLNRMLRFVHWERYVDYLERAVVSTTRGGVVVSTEQRRLIKTLFLLVIASLWGGSIWYFIADLTGGTNNWLVNDSTNESLNINDASLGGLVGFMRSVYFVLVGTSTIGYGDIIPRNTWETLYATILVLFGGLLKPAVLGGMASLLLNTHAARRRFELSLHAIQHWADSCKLSVHLKGRIYRWQSYSWERHRGMDENAVLQSLPPSLRGDAIRSLWLPYLQNWTLGLTFLNEHILTRMLHELTPVTYLHGERIATCGEVCRAFHFITSGRVRISNVKSNEIIVVSAPNLSGLDSPKHGKEAKRKGSMFRRISMNSVNLLRSFIRSNDVSHGQLGHRRTLTPRGRRGSAVFQESSDIFGHHLGEQGVSSCDSVPADYDHSSEEGDSGSDYFDACSTDEFMEVGDKFEDEEQHDAVLRLDALAVAVSSELPIDDDDLSQESDSNPPQSKNNLESYERPSWFGERALLVSGGGDSEEEICNEDDRSRINTHNFDAQGYVECLVLERSAWLENVVPHLKPKLKREFNEAIIALNTGQSRERIVSTSSEAVTKSFVACEVSERTLYLARMERMESFELDFSGKHHKGPLHRAASDESFTTARSEVKNSKRVSGFLPWLQDSLHRFAYPNSGARQLWSTLLLLVILWNAFWVPFRLAFFHFNSVVFGLSFLLDVAFILDVYLNYRVLYFVTEGKVERRRSKIAERYRDSGHMPLDIIAGIPWEILACAWLNIDTNSTPRPLYVALALCRLPKMLRLYQLPDYFALFEDAFVSRISHLSKRQRFRRAIRLLRLGIGVFLIAHWAACAFYFIARWENGWRSCEMYDSQYNVSWDVPEVYKNMPPAAQCRFNHTWLQLQFESRLVPPGKSEQRGTSTWTNYVRAMNWSLPTLLVVVIGDSIPITALETGFVLIIVFSALIVTAEVLGSVINLIADSGTEHSRHRARVNRLEGWMRSSELPQIMKNRVRAYLKYLWTEHGGTEPDRVLQSLPHALRHAVTTELSFNLVRESRVLADCDNALLLDVAKMVMPILFAKHDIVLCKHEPIALDGLLFIAKGSVEVMDHNSEDPLVALGIGHCVGDIVLEFIDENGPERRVSIDRNRRLSATAMCLRRHGNVRAAEHCLLWRLSHTSARDVLSVASVGDLERLRVRLVRFSAWHASILAGGGVVDLDSFSDENVVAAANDDLALKEWLGSHSPYSMNDRRVAAESHENVIVQCGASEAVSSFATSALTGRLSSSAPKTTPKPLFLQASIPEDASTRGLFTTCTRCWAAARDVYRGDLDNNAHLASVADVLCIMGTIYAAYMPLLRCAFLFVEGVSTARMLLWFIFDYFFALTLLMVDSFRRTLPYSPRDFVMPVLQLAADTAALCAGVSLGSQAGWRALCYSRLVSLAWLWRIEVHSTAMLQAFARHRRLRLRPCRGREWPVGSLLVLHVLLLYLVTTHWLACGWMFLARVNDLGDDHRSWLSVDGLQLESFAGSGFAAKPYVRALYFTITVLSTVGYGDIRPYGNLEACYYLTVCVVGALLFATLIGSIAAMIEMSDASGGNAVHKKLLNLRLYAHARGIGEDVHASMRRHVLMMWDRTGGISEHEVSFILPRSLLTDCLLYTKCEVMKSVPAFRAAPIPVQRRLALLLRPHVLAAGSVACREGEPGVDGLYFVAEGSIGVTFRGDQHLLLRRGDSFGCTNDGGFYAETARAVTDATLYSLSKEGVRSAIRGFTDSEKRSSFESRLVRPSRSKGITLLS